MTYPKALYTTYLTPFDNGAGNDNTALIPQIWSAESILLLWKELQMARLVYTNFKNEVAVKGQIINVPKPPKYTSNRTNQKDRVTDQDATVDNVQIALNQNFDVSFIIKDEEESLTERDLIEFHLPSAIRAIAESVETLVSSERFNFMPNQIGQLGQGYSRSLDVDLRTKMSNMKIPKADRYMVHSPTVGGALLKDGDLPFAYALGDEGTALRSGNIGRLNGIQHIETNAFEVFEDTDTIETAIDNPTGYPAGTTSFTIDVLGSAPTVGSYLTIAGDMTPLRVTSSTTTSVTVATGTRFAVADGAVVTIHVPFLVNNVAGYDYGHISNLTVDGRTEPVISGYPLSAGGKYYGAIDTDASPLSTTNLNLTRPLETALSNNDPIGVLPSGDYSLAFIKEAIALVTRPMKMPRTGNVKGSVQSIEGISVRVTMSDDHTARGTRVIVDVLCGVKTLDTDKGVLVLS